jgi:hypothetical protein
MDLPPRVRAVISSVRIWPGGIAFAAISGKSHLEAGAGHQTVRTLTFAPDAPSAK